MTTHIRIIIIAALLFLLPLFNQTAQAVDCWGKTCPGPGCCGDHGYCVALNTCTCDTGYSGSECTANFCGSMSCSATCGGRGYCLSSSGVLTPGYAGVCACSQGYTGSCCQTLVSSLSVAAIDFGSQTLGSSSPSRGMIFTNPTKDSITIAVNGITLSGANSGDFVIGGNCAGATLAVGGSCNVTVAFAPAAVGSRSATLSLVATPPALPATTLTASLSGTGIIATDSIVIDSNNQARLYAGLDGGGIYSSSDSGATWIPATTQPANLRIKALVIDKNDSTKLYTASYGGGVFKSTDSSATWNACATQPTNLNLLSLIIDGSGKLYAGTEAGVFVSTDGCGTWSAMSSGLP